MNGQPFLMIFSPQNSTLDVLDATLTRERRALADTLIKSVKESLRRKSSNHHLLIGPRGSGKTHILAFVRKTIERDSSSFPGVKVLALSEEERGLTTLLDFLLACLRAGDFDTTPFLKEVAGLPRTEVEQLATHHIEQLADDNLVLVFLENLSALLSALGGNESDRLRAFLQTHSNFSLLASSTELFQDSSRPDHPFYGFFNITSLRALKQKETGDYLASLAESRGDHKLAAELRQPKARPRLRAIYDLTGGNHRLLAMLGNFLTKDGLADLVDPFVKTVDRELTPYYQQRLDRLSPQQNKILRTIADQHGRALPVKEIATLIFSDSQTVSRQLHDLLHCGLVRRKPLGRESYYELNEPLMRLVLDIKEGRGRPLPLIVSFLTGWHTIDELQELAQKSSPEASLYYKQACVKVKGRLAVELFSKGLKYGELGQTVDEIETYDEIIKRFGESDAVMLKEGAVAMALLNKGVALGELERIEEAIETYDEIIKRFGKNDAVVLKEAVARALINKGVALGQLEQTEEAIETYDEIIKRFGESDQPGLQKRVAWALFNKGVALGQLDQPEDEIEIYDKIIKRFGKSDQPDLQKQVAWALVNKGIALGNLGRREDEIISYTEVFNRARSSHRPELWEPEAKALVNKGITLGNLARLKDAVTTYDVVIERFGGSEQLELQKQVSIALVNKGAALDKLGRHEDAIAIYDKVVENFGVDDSLALQAAVSKALINKGIALSETGHYVESGVLYDEVIDRFGASHHSELLEQVVGAWVEKGVVFGRLERDKEAIAIFDEIIEQFGSSHVPAIVESVAIAFYNKGISFRKSGLAKEEISAYDEFVKRYEKATSLVIRVYVAQALVNKSIALGKLGQAEAAILICEDITKRFGESDAEELTRVVARAQITEILLSLELGHLDEGFDMIKSFIVQFPKDLPILSTLVGIMLNVLIDKPRLLERLSSIFSGHPQLLAEGLINWVRGLIPLDAAQAQELEKAEIYLKTAWGLIPDCALPLKVLNAVRRDALGDEKALLELPLEVRKLVSSATANES